MTPDESTSCDVSGRPLADASHVGADRGMLLFLLLGTVAVLLPHVCLPFVGIYGSAGMAIVVAVLWCQLMPTGCLNGGLICSLVMLAVLGNAIGFVLGVVVRFVVSWSG